jgi:hypothetical protein
MLVDMNEQQLSLYYEDLMNNDEDDCYIANFEDNLLYNGYEGLEMSPMLLFNLATRYLYRLIDSKKNELEFELIYNDITDELDRDFSNEYTDIINLDSTNMKEYVENWLEDYMIGKIFE